LADFHPLRVAAVDRLTDDAVAVTFEVPAELAADYVFHAGQHLTLRRWFDDQEVRRTYSVCSPVGGALRVGIKRSGLMSTWLCDDLEVGDELDVLPPLGSFGPREALQGKRFGLIAAGSRATGCAGSSRRSGRASTRGTCAAPSVWWRGPARSSPRRVQPACTSSCSTLRGSRRARWSSRPRAPS
jgi:ring-1,2-phenylacetyl-CoA epoxidase subunit PaaE